MDDGLRKTKVVDEKENKRSKRGLYSSFELSRKGENESKEERTAKVVLELVEDVAKKIKKNMHRLTKSIDYLRRG